MNRLCGLCISGSLLLGLFAGVVPAQAGIYGQVARGLSLFDYNISGERNLLGDGITVNANAFYNNRDFNFGIADLTLNGMVNASAGFTRRGIPGAKFSLNTGGTQLAYNFVVDNGGQSLTATGSVLVNIDSKINALGFYHETLQISNRGTYTTDGLFGESTGALDFDRGPIDVSGNLYADVLAAVTQPFFTANGLENPFAQFSQQSSKLAAATKSVESLQARLAAGEKLSDADLSALINNSILAAMLGGKPSGDLLNNVLLPVGLLESGQGTARLTIVPEPTSVALLALALAAGVHRRRRSV